MERIFVQKIGKGLLVGLAGFFAISLLLFFVMMFFMQGRGHGTSTHDRMMPQLGMIAGEDGYGPGGESDFDMMKRGPGSDMMAEVMPYAADVVMSDESGASGSGLVEEKKVMKNGNMDMRVESVEWSLGRIQSIAAERGGSVANSSFTEGTDSVKSGWVTVKVPVEKFDDTFAALKSVAALVVSENISGTDVTEQYIDVTARVKNKKAQEEALQNILTKAEKVTDIIEITRELGSVRGEIESLEGQLRYLNSQTDMASITLSLTEDTQVAGDKSFRPGQTLTESVQELLRGMGHIVNGFIALAIVGIPLLLLFGLILWGVFAGARKIVNKMWN